MRRMPSSSMRLPCSIEATPARVARLIASAPWACAATLRPHIAASSTTALSSSCEYCGAPTDSSSDKTPALASTLMRSAPYFTSNRIFSRIWLTPLAIPVKPSNRRYGDMPFTSPWPPVAERGIVDGRSEEHTSELQSRLHLVCRLLLEKKKKRKKHKRYSRVEGM